MANTYFKFKQFTVLQDKCAMKVGTDGVILGAYVNCSKANKILDIGTGTGLIALMLAQKYDAKIFAIDIDLQSYIQACENVNNSKWNTRIHVCHTSFQDFAKSYKKNKFDCIVTNPPYFTNSLKAPDNKRALARHNDNLPFNKLLEGINVLLDVAGSFYIILPNDAENEFSALAESSGLYRRKLLFIKTIPQKSHKRCVIEYGKTPCEIKKETILIETGERHSYSIEYKNLTKDFYLDF